ncbi:MAG: molybdopterin oxidoreductase family protein [Blastocatellia bacterium]
MRYTRSLMETRTHCPYCALQCGMTLMKVDSGIAINGDEMFPVNNGALCVKGATAGETLNHPDRLTTPLVRNARGVQVPADWDEALTVAARAFKDVQVRNGKDAVGVFGGGSLTNEKAYLLGKFARVALRTSNIDYNGRFCMSSAAAASIRAFGIDRGLPFPLEDISSAELILLAGSNVAETMPPIMRYFEAQRSRGGRLIVVDPRTSITAQKAALHLRLIPGSDAALANGLVHILVREGMIDSDFIRARTEGFEQLKSIVTTYWPERVERITGVPESELIRAARMLGTARSAMILTGRGPEQQSHGVANAMAYINIALTLGMVGRPGSGYGCLTGQGNGQGGREHGQKADQLPGYRRIDDPASRRHIASIWGIDETEIPGPGLSAYEMLDSAGRDGGVRALMIIGSNAVVSAPHSLHIEDRLKSLYFLAVADFFKSETAELADVVFPTAQWAEEEGTMTNLEGRVIRRRHALDPPVGVRSDIEVLCGLASKMAKGEFFQLNSEREVFDELRRASHGGPADYSGITYDKIDSNDGIFWPCPSEGHPGTKRLFSDGFPTPSGRAQFHAVRHQRPAEAPEPEYPLYLTTGRVLAQYQSGTQTRRIAELEELSPGPVVEMHPATARRYRLIEGNAVTLSSRRGAATFKLKVTSAIREDTLFVPFHWSGDQSANRLTNPALDPISKMPEFKVCAVRIVQE